MSRDESEKPGAENQLFLFGEITDEATQDIVERIVSDWGREYLLFINSDGGSSFNALALVNLLKLHGRVDTVCLGVALSGAADTLAAGRRRYVVPNAVAMIHQVSWDLGNEFTANLVRNAQFVDRLNDQLAEMLARDSGQSKEQLLHDMVTDHYLFGQEIIEYGLADEFFDPAALLRPRPHGRRGARIRETSEGSRRV
jgi:ATP-dependent Clp endopeptidase proteolytic subunit ClpP